MSQEQATQAHEEEIESGQWYTVKEAADALGIGYEWCRRLINKGRLQGVKPTGGHWRIPASEIDRLKKQGLQPIEKKAQTSARQIEELPVPIDIADRIAPERQPEGTPDAGRPGSGGFFRWNFFA